MSNILNVQLIGVYGIRAIDGLEQKIYGINIMKLESPTYSLYEFLVTF